MPNESDKSAAIHSPSSLEASGTRDQKTLAKAMCTCCCRDFRRLQNNHEKKLLSSSYNSEQMRPAQSLSAEPAGALPARKLLDSRVQPISLPTKAAVTGSRLGLIFLSSSLARTSGYSYRLSSSVTRSHQWLLLSFEQLSHSLAPVATLFPYGLKTLRFFCFAIRCTGTKKLCVYGAPTKHVEKEIACLDWLDVD